MIAADIDAVATGTVIVFGSLPPEGRDLDLLVRPDDERTLVGRLSDAGFVASGRTWARFGAGRPEAVEVVGVDRWRLTDEAARSLFAEAVPLSGFVHLARPAPHHALLILARRVARDGVVDERRLAKALAAVDEAGDAWARAAADAPGWRAERAVALLRAAVDSGGSQQPARRVRAEAVAGEFGDGLEATLRGWRTVAAPPRCRAVVVAFSGLDGSGKTTQVESLVETLEALGVDAERVWVRLAFNPRLWRLGSVAKRLLRPAARGKRSGSAPASAPADVDPSRIDDPLRRLRYNSRFLTWAWSTIVTAENVRAQRRQVRAVMARRQVVVCDRYALDSAVHLRYRYGESRRFPFQRFVLRVLSPKPVAAFLLDVPGAEAAARKVDQYDVGQLERQARLYREECERWGAVRLDGRRPPEELAVEIATTVWPALRS